MLKGGHGRAQKKPCACVCVSIGSHRVQCYEGRSGLVTERPDVTQHKHASMGGLQSSVSLKGVIQDQTILYCRLFSTVNIFYLRSDMKWALFHV